MRILISILVISLILQCSLSAQEIITTAGDNPKTNNASLQWTLGQIVTGTTTNGSTTLFNGYQQSTIIITKISELELSNKLSVYPNPAKSYINIEIETQENLSLIVKVYNVSGKKYYQSSIKQKKHIIDVTKFIKGTYILQISEMNKIVSNYKIIVQ